MAQQTYDLLVIGAGASGSAAVSAVDKRKMRVGLVERNLLGGTCLNYGCDPTKTMIHIAELLYSARHAKGFGLRIPQATGSALKFTRDRASLQSRPRSLKQEWWLQLNPAYTSQASLASE